MTSLRNQDWQDSIQSAAKDACAQCGNDVVKKYLQEHFGVSTTEELSPTDYDQAFDDLDMMGHE